MPDNLIHHLLISASLGALVGLVRQWGYQREHPGQEAPAGLRTFTAWAILGCAAAELQRLGANWLLAAVFLGYALVLGGVHLLVRENRPLGLTTYSVALITFLAGSLTAYGEYQFALAMGVAAMLILGSKDWSHSWTRKLNQADLASLLQFAAITGLVLPIAPNVDYGPPPFNAFNPFKIWLMVVMISGLGFAGYVAVRWLGTRAGFMITGLAGGLASSTATTLAFSRQSRSTPNLYSNLALAVVLACTVMLARLAVVLTVINYDVALLLLWPFVLMALPGVGWALWAWFFQRKKETQDVETPNLTNPLSLPLAIKFGLLYGVITLIVKIASTQVSPAWIYGVSFVSGLTDMDAIAISSAQAAKDNSLSVDTAAHCILIAALANTLVKTGLALALGTPHFRRLIFFALGAVFVAGIGGWFLI